MRIRSAVAVAATLAVAGGVMSGVAANADEADAPPSAPSADTTVEPSLAVAEGALEEAELLFDDDPATLPSGDRDATMVLRDLVLNRSKLSGAERRSANRLLARPGAQKKKCARQVCVHWSNTGPHRVSQIDRRPRNGTPDYVDKVLRTVSKVHRTYVRAGYRAPLTDGGQGGNKKRDIYLRNVGSQGLYGYCTSDRSGKRVPAYCVLDNNYSRAEFPTNGPIGNMRVTAAHEYFHAVQFAYDIRENLWFMEATATWAEDELFDGVNDNLNYLPFGQIGVPSQPLDSAAGLNVYGNWVYFRYLTERMPASKAGLPVLVRDMWRGAGKRLNSLQAIRRELADRGRSFPTTYAQFAAANRRTTATYAEGKAYPNSPLRTPAITLTSSTTEGTSNGTLDHLTSATVQFRPGAGLGGDGQKIELRVRMADSSHGSRLVVTTYRTDGTVSVRNVALTPSGDIDHETAFETGIVSRVEATLVNTSSRLGTPYNNQQANVTGEVIPLP